MTGVKIELEYYCTCTDGVCAWSEPLCIEMGENEEAWVCPYLEARRK